ncbi:MAG: thioredoxin family protein [Bacilli bacterium]|nr:thioredoxin family protein [Bacilli bacterium]
MKNNTENLLKRILVCAYIIIALLAINTIIQFVSNVKITSESETETETTEEYDVSMFDTVDTEKTINLFDSKDIQVIYIGRSTCGYCVKFLPVLQQAQKEFGYKTKYLDITTVTTEEQQNAILAKDNDEGFLSQNFGSTPMVLLVKDGKIVKGWVGYAEYDEFAKFLIDNGINKD